MIVSQYQLYNVLQFTVEDVVRLTEANIGNWKKEY